VVPDAPPPGVPLIRRTIGSAMRRARHHAFRIVALAERLGEPLASKDRGLASSAWGYGGIRVIELAAPS